MSGCKECKDIYKKPCEQLNYLDVANNCTDLRKLVEDIKAEVIEEHFTKIMSFINTSNRGNCDYFIVDQIENYIAEQLKENK